ncbi:MAG: anthranilate phosphoribosyltransferase, partial [Lentisphaerae bacterium]|nr:anthranilate phosphoribosyltransferase [Lentisphaerota bacterium]
VPSSQIAAFLVALRIKGESVAELSGAALSMRQHALFVETGGLSVVDTCGTGGDGLNTFNISTTSAFVAAGAGAVIAKHGNRGVGGSSGSADVLAAAGVNIDVPVDVVEKCIHDVGIGFLFAPKVHPSMRYVAEVRKEIGLRTIFNMLGPLTNPAGANGQLVGVFAPELTEVFAHVLKDLGVKRALVVHGRDGMDEITLTASTRVTELYDGKVSTGEFDPALFFDGYCSIEELRGGTPEVNAQIMRSVLSGTKGPARDITLLNAAATLVVAGQADSIRDGLPSAEAAIDDGSALDVLERLVEATN